MTTIELLGYSASIFIAVSLLMSNIKLLRYVNSVGCVLWVIYGLLIPAYPVVVMNAFCFLINLYQLWKLSKQTDKVGENN